MYRINVVNFLFEHGIILSNFSAPKDFGKTFHFNIRLQNPYIICIIFYDDVRFLFLLHHNSEFTYICKISK